MGNFINELKASGNLKALWDFRKGSLLDISGNGNHFAINTGTMSFIKANGNLSLTGAGGLKVTTPTGLDLVTGTIFVVFKLYKSTIATANMLFMKGAGAGTLLNGYHLYLSSTPTLALGDGSTFQTAGLATQNVAKLVAAPIACASFSWDGSVIKGFANGIQDFLGAQTKIPSPAVSSAYIGQGVSPSYLADSSVLYLMASNSILTPKEHSRLYEEFLLEGNSSDLARKNFVQIPRGLTDAEYNAKGIVLDTNFSTINIAGTRKVIDMGPNNYSGTIVGVAPAANSDGSGLIFPTAATNAYFGDVTQLNSTSAFTIEHQISYPVGNIVSNFLLMKNTDVNNNIDIEPFGALATTKKAYIGICNASATYGTTNATVFRAGCNQHYMVVYNGAGATNADKSQFYVDGELYAQTYVGTLPVTTANLVTKVLYAGFTGSASAIVNHHALKVYNAALTATDVRGRYLEFAKKVLFKETFEDIPVSLAAATVGQMVGKWQVASGSWKCSEDTSGKRWLECVTAGNIILTNPDPYSFGTKTFKVNHIINSNFRFGVFLPTQQVIGAADPGATQKGYSYQISTANAFALWRLDSGVSPAVLWATADNYLAFNTEYTITVSRRPSDGFISTWVNGGVLTNAVPSAPVADAIYVPTPCYFQVQGSVGDKICLYDPNDKKVGITHYQGQLNPVNGEL